MKTSRFADSQGIAVLKQAEAGTPVPELCRTQGISSATFYKWRATFASRVGIVDTVAITKCAEGDTPAAVEIISRAHAWANQIELTGTPAILVNGHKLVRPASAAQLDTLIRWFAKKH